MSVARVCNSWTNKTRIFVNQAEKEMQCNKRDIHRQTTKQFAPNMKLLLLTTLAFHFFSPLWARTQAKMILPYPMSVSSTACPKQFECGSQGFGRINYHNRPAYRPSVAIKKLEPKCIPFESVCDGIKDCPDRSDEKADCVCWGEENTSFRCKGEKKKCIPEIWVCDGVKDCGFGEDESEANCAAKNSNAKRQYKCLKRNQGFNNNGGRIPWAWKCDGEQDCPKGDDEKFCETPYPEAKCPETSFKCKDSSTCLDSHSVCDNVLDCPLGDDEQKCTKTIIETQILVDG